MEWNRDQVVETIAKDSQATEKIAPICRLCGQKHWPLDPSCPGKKGRKARIKAKTENKANKTTQSKIQSEQNIKRFAKKIARIKEESAKAISDVQKQLNAETEAKSKAQAQAQAEIRARIEAEKSIRKEIKDRAEAEKEFQIRLKQKSQAYEDELSRAFKRADSYEKELEDIKHKLGVEKKLRGSAEARANTEIEIRTKFEAQVTERTRSLVDELDEVKTQAKEKITKYIKTIQQVEKKLAAETKARELAERKTSIEIEKRAELKEQINTFPQKIGQIEAEASQAVSDVNEKLKAETEQRAKAQTALQAELQNKKRIEEKSKLRVDEKLDQIQLLREQLELKSKIHEQEIEKVTSEADAYTKLAVKVKKQLEIETAGRNKAEKIAQSEADEKNSIQTRLNDKIQKLSEKIIQLEDKSENSLPLTTVGKMLNKERKELKKAREKIKSLTESKKTTQKKVRSEVRARAKVEKIAERERHTRIEAEKNLQLERKKRIRTEKKAVQDISKSNKKLQMLQEEKVEALAKVENEVKARVKAEEKADLQSKIFDSSEIQWQERFEESIKRYEQQISIAQKQIRDLEKEIIHTKQKYEAEADTRARANNQAEQNHRLHEQAKNKIGSLEQKIDVMETEFTQSFEKARTESIKIIEEERRTRIEAEQKAQEHLWAKEEAEEKALAEAQLRDRAEKKVKAQMKNKMRLEAIIKQQLDTASERENYSGMKISRGISWLKPALSLFAENNCNKKDSEGANSAINQKILQNNEVNTPNVGTGALLSIRAIDIMQQNLIWADGEDTIEQVLAKMKTHNTDYIIIGTGGRADGVVAKTDLHGYDCSHLQEYTSKWRNSQYDASLQIAVKWVMNKHVCALSSDTTFAGIMKSMHQNGMRALPIVGVNGQILGLVTPYNVLKVRALLKLESNPNILTQTK
ncbi:MAG: CBS domain-containing protein [Planctomycetota bacterium]|jgi:CBS domain-containing protein